MNKVIVLGNLTKDPELKELPNSQVCKFTIAINRKFKDQNEVCFIEVNAWNGTATFVTKYFTKGSPILIEGRLKQDIWEKDGQRHQKHVIIAETVNFVPQTKQEPIKTREIILPKDLQDNDLPF